MRFETAKADQWGGHASVERVWCLLRRLILRSLVLQLEALTQPRHTQAANDAAQ